MRYKVVMSFELLAADDEHALKDAAILTNATRYPETEVVAVYDESGNQIEASEDDD